MGRKKKSEIGGFNIWRSYSDMMAGVLLLFVLIMCVTLFQAQKSYDESLQERDEKIRLQEEYTAELLAQQMELDEKNGQLQTQNEQLNKQEVLLAELAAQLKEKEAMLAAQQVDLDEKTQMLVSQQKKIDKIIGVKAEVVESLQKEFKNNNVKVNIDSQTGALILDANVMFDVDQAELTKEGQATLAQVLPIYCKVLLQEEHLPYLAEIIIDGYTDDDGDYAYNLELSQRRSLAVADYLLETQSQYLTGDESQKLEKYLTVNGHSKSNPVLDENGNVDKDASRRVEVKFRLKDDEMIDELNSLMSEATEGAAAQE